jgi:hypothetical protein
MAPHAPRIARAKYRRINQCRGTWPYFDWLQAEHQDANPLFADPERIPASVAGGIADKLGRAPASDTRRNLDSNNFYLGLPDSTKRTLT